MVAYQNANTIDIFLICTSCLYVSACFLIKVTIFGNVEFFWFHITETKVLFKWHKINKIILFRILVEILKIRKFQAAIIH